ncbi:MULTISPECIES: 5-deoxy-glucuronate isomerase [unclassified Janthinobacterium]|uniref:5-deoxy-glucuronate isomerase n=1 Tax=unclassified Janthinobacterium TaxID=2610881 RepID=UPI000A3284BD|nr:MULTISPECIES: 5-deoxy-glucuronate isomerase [unclassified Janthinobacterium]
MSPLLVKAKSGSTIVEVTPASAGWTHVGFAAHRLQAGEHISLETGRRELCLVVLTGTVTVRAGEHEWRAIGKRQSVFEDVSPYAVYVPLETAVSITAESKAEVALCSAPATTKRPARLIEPASMTRSVRGQGANTRYVCDILPQTEEADGLLVVEVVTPSGHSSSYPPHKHDSDNVPLESSLEETYYHRLHPEQGFAYQRVYTDDRSIDEAMAVENHDVVMVPRGYHPVTVPYGYDGYYLNVMAGPKRVWHFKNDPAHDWLMTK